jgi:tetratricopeptide (TPR) repeat protein
VSTQVLGRSARARVLAARGSFDEAQRLARDAVERSEATDDLNMRGDTLVDLGEVLDAAGDREGAVAALDSALRLYEEKRNAAAVEVTRRRRSALEG